MKRLDGFSQIKKKKTFLAEGKTIDNTHQSSFKLGKIDWILY